MEISPHLLVVAIDFGSTFSGFAYSFRNQYNDNPTKVSGKVCRETGSLKVPTCILLKPDTTFEAFGYAAEDRYGVLVSEQKHEDWYFFKHFKMQIYENPTREGLLEDNFGKKLPAMTIFAEAITYLKDEALRICTNEDKKMKKEHVRWVLTTPAIWNDDAKQFMREAAEKAGINNDSLTIALEPEVASIYCRHMELQRVEQTHSSDLIAAFSPGTQYAVLDAGGGTVDVTVHEVNTDRTLKEIHHADGGPWGGTMVDVAFLQFIRKIIETPKMQTFQNEFREDYIELMRKFEICKQDVSLMSDMLARFRVPAESLELFDGNIEDVLKQMHIKDEVKLKRDQMTLTAKTMRRMFNEPVKQTTQYIETILNKIPSVSYVVMVGGFAKSPMLQESIRSALSGRNVHILIPGDAGNAVLKGAVIYGHDTSSITHRSCRYTYGVEIMSPFEKGKHDEKRKYTDESGTVLCKGCFSIHVKKEQMLRCGKWLDEHGYNVVSSDQTAIRFPIFFSRMKTPTYTDDPGCTRHGELTIPMPDTIDGMDRGAVVQFCYSGTELLVRATDKKTGKRIKSSVDFLV